VAYRHSQQELLQKLLAAADARIAAGGEEQQDPAGMQSLAATAAVLAAVEQLQQDAGEMSCILPMIIQSHFKLVWQLHAAALECCSATCAYHATSMLTLGFLL
jgi:hypothetical protein